MKQLFYLAAEEKLALGSSVAMLIAVLIVAGKLNGASTTRAEVAVLLATAVPIVRWFKQGYLVRGFPRLLAGIAQTACIAFCMGLLYQVSGDLTVAIHAGDYDNMLIAADRWIFGGHSPSIWIAEHNLIAPAIVELMQLCYSLYYTLPLALGIELWVRRKRISQAPFDTFSFVMIYGFILSCIGYLLVPAIGPRFTLHEFQNLSTDLPGIWITEPLRRWTNSGELINSAMSSAEASKHVLRDAFPSGHTMITLLVLTLAFRYRCGVRFILLPLGIGLILATVYLRYHYAIDVIGGIGFAIFTLITAPLFYRLLSAQTTKLYALPKNSTTGAAAANIVVNRSGRSSPRS